MSREFITAAGLAALLVAARPFASAGGAEGARLAVAWMVLVGLPALLLALPFASRRGLFDAIAAGTAASLALFSVLAVGVHVAGWGLGLLLALHTPAVVAAAIAAIALERRRAARDRDAARLALAVHAPGRADVASAPARARRAAPHGATTAARRADTNWTLAVLLFAAAAVAIGTVWGRPADFRMDVYDHAGAAARVEARDRVLSREMSDGREGAYLDPRKGTWNTLLAAVLRLSGAEPLAMWGSATLVASLVGALAFARLARELLGRAWPLGAMLLLLAQEGGPGGGWLSRSAYPGTLAIFLYVLFLAETLAAVRGRRGVPIGLALALPLVHLLAGLFALAAIGLLAILLRARSNARAQADAEPAAGDRAHGSVIELLAPRIAPGLMRGLVAAGLAIAGAGAWRTAAAGPLTNTVQTEPQGILSLWGGLFVPEPRTLFERLGVEGFLALLIAPLLVARARRDLGLAWMLLLAALLLLLVTPPVATLLGRRLGYLMRRLPALAPLPILLAFLAEDLLRRARAAGAIGAMRRARVASLAAIALVALPAFRVGQAAAVASEGPHATTAQATAEAAWHADLARLAPHLPAGACVATDPATGYVVYARTLASPLVLPDQHAAPNDGGAGERLTDLARILSPWTGEADRRALLDEHGVTRILVNEGFREPTRTYGYPISPENLALLRGVLDRNPDAYSLIDEAGSLRLYGVAAGIDARIGAGRGAGDSNANDARLESDGSHAPIESIVPENPYRAADAARPESFVASDAGVAVGTARVESERVAAGEIVTVSCRLARDAAALPIGDYRAFLALTRERDGGDAVGGGTRFAKVARSVRSLFGAAPDRVVFEREIAGGRYPVLLWAPHESVVDRYFIRAPRNLPPGRYRVTMNVVRLAFFQNRSLGALFSDDDEYARIDVGTVEVVRAGGAT